PPVRRAVSVVSIIPAENLGAVRRFSSGGTGAGRGGSVGENGQPIAECRAPRRGRRSAFACVVAGASIARSDHSTLTQCGSTVDAVCREKWKIPTAISVFVQPNQQARRNIVSSTGTWQEYLPRLWIESSCRRWSRQNGMRSRHCVRNDE